jgi:hypothetical protein
MGNYISCNTKYKGYNSSVTIIVLLKIVPLDTSSSDKKTNISHCESKFVYSN